MSFKKDVDVFIKDTKGVVDELKSRKELKALGEEALRLVFTRTRLGYGVKRDGESRYKLSTVGFSEGYLATRRRVKNLSEFTRPSKHNLTFTGQLLNKMDVIRIQNGKITIGWSGSKDRRSEGTSNQEVADFVSDRRPFLNLSNLEIKKLERFYSLTFGDLLKRKKALL